MYVHYNLRLQNRLKEDKRPYDPVDYESIDKTEFWVVDEEAEGELNIDELENMLEEDPPNNEPSTYQPWGLDLTSNCKMQSVNTSDVLYLNYL